MASSDSNTTTRQALTSWLFPVILAALIALSGYTWMGLSSRVDSIQNVAQEDRQRLSVIETNYRAIENRLIRIENKLDRIGGTSTEGLR